MRGRELGAGVREAVRRAGLTGRAAAELAGWDHGKLSDLINGKGGTNEVELSRLLGVLRTPIGEHEHLLTLFREADRSGWLQISDKVPVQLRTLIEHESAATEIVTWSVNLVPGLLQTPDYLRALILAYPTTPDNEADERVAALVARQKIVDRPRELTVYIHEQALRLPVGGAAVMSDQLHHLLRMSVRSYITLRVVPIAIGAHAGTAGSFTLMKFSRIQPVIHAETENASIFLDDKASADIYWTVLAALDRTALDTEQSKEMITRVAT